MDSQTTPNTPRRSRRSKIVGTVIALAVMAALGGGAWYLTHSGTSAQGGPGMGGPGGAGGPGGPGGRRGGPSTTVGVATAVKSDLPVVLDALGTVTAASTVTVRPQVSGILKELKFKEGGMVKAGQVVAQIDPAQFEMALMQATGQRQRDEAQLENARLTLKRYQTLLGQDSIARQDVDTQAALVKQLEGTVMTDRAAEGTARLNLGYTKVVSPISGRAGLKVVDIGNLVSTSDTGGVVVVTQLSPIDVEFSVPQDKVQTIQERLNSGSALAALALDRTRTHTLDKGSLSALDNQVDVQTGTVRAKARYTNDKMALFPSQFVNVRLELGNITGAVLVPVTALRHSNNGDFVYVLKADKTVTVRMVTRGQATTDMVEIRAGLEAGEQVITEGADRLKEGAKVTLAGDKPAMGGAGGAGTANGERRHRRQHADGAASASASASAPASAPAATPAKGAAQ
ncbi:MULTISPECIES: efflux RND transporter periplasmic adaptor subunit [Janthinobacterium]|uniref:efflux RND transporter periplasmic adaptor subunit n=1 Tax=Janthinobacterium TaxID=29580 RepID=UPI0008736076|nr:MULTISPECIES: efflux RND transporter periplasmic adaptor subunit [Janthinobacterium]MCC7711835.1 efflux RND transporter periplasmic adaptor subunit [Janthinobacterium lividum]OEZ58356.1 multidrug resistance protein MdtA precursor [Janthinobacterium lividum]PHV51749.1 efflux RND transporter periplasmic adaptor subunit [Janthinobacterium sp. BJB301]WQE27469.1 efflux RND transporter periplasmic adaptor subunit [Janthinobacterium lividum]SDG88471.1 membrane fusion protein, multidrug efflux syst